MLLPPTSKMLLHVPWLLYLLYVLDPPLLGFPLLLLVILLHRHRHYHRHHHHHHHPRRVSIATPRVYCVLRISSMKRPMRSTASFLSCLLLMFACLPCTSTTKTSLNNNPSSYRHPPPPQSPLLHHPRSRLYLLFRTDTHLLRVVAHVLRITTSTVLCSVLCLAMRNVRKCNWTRWLCNPSHRVATSCLHRHRSSLHATIAPPIGASIYVRIVFLCVVVLCYVPYLC